MATPAIQQNIVLIYPLEDLSRNLYLCIDATIKCLAVISGYFWSHCTFTFYIFQLKAAIHLAV